MGKKNAKRKIQIGIIGPERKNLPKGNKGKSMLILANKIGELIAQNKAILITGGCSGIAEAACQGAYNYGDVIIGTPGRKRLSSNKFITVEICTPIEIGDYLFAGILSCDSIIVFPGDAGTLAELAIAYRYRKPLVFMKNYGENLLKNLFNSFDQDYPIFIAKNAKEAVNLAIKSANKNLKVL